ncbi:MAG: SnoaL-like domain-containing protein [Deltaproteobacteria bacterium]|nr:SnoaL-like domain-containing protein [Deltaproteobacteria bacterium]
MSTPTNLRQWEDHIVGEFVTKDVERALATMVEDASVMHMPTRSGGQGKAALRAYYRDLFIPSIPSEWQHTMTNRIVTEGAIVEEATIRFHHTKQMDWFLPGVPPTNQWIEVELVIVIEFRDGKMATERIYWDQAAVLRQIGRQAS